MVPSHRLGSFRGEVSLAEGGRVLLYGLATALRVVVLIAATSLMPRFLITITILVF